MKKRARMTTEADSMTYDIKIEDWVKEGEKCFHCPTHDILYKVPSKFVMCPLCQVAADVSVMHDEINDLEKHLSKENEND